MKNRVILQLMLTAMAVSVLAGCSTEYFDDYEMKHDCAELVVKVRIPGTELPTKALSVAQEHEVQTLDAIVFLDNGDEEVFLYMVHATDIVNDGGGLEKSYKINLQKSNGYSHRIVLLANLRAEIDSAVPQFTSNTTKEEALAMIEFDSSSAWDTGKNFRPVPMYGEAPKTYIITSGTHIETIAMRRSVVRIDVGLDIDSGSPKGLGDLFKMSEIRVYNTNSLGAAVPLTADVEADVPTIPEGAVKNEYHSFKAEEHGLMRGIYVSEAFNRSSLIAHEDVACVLIGGYYTPPGSVGLNEDEQTWYRIDFYDGTSTSGNRRLNLMRNGRYMINITRVDGPGYDTAEEAFKSAPMNMTSNIVSWWDNKDINDVIMDGQYMLGVSEREFRIGKRGASHAIIEVETTHPDGWSCAVRRSADPNDAAAVGDDHWLYIDQAFCEGNYLCFGVRENTGRYERTGYIHITAGKMTCVVKVVQTPTEILVLEIDPEHEIRFPSGLIPQEADAMYKELEIGWAPAVEGVTVSVNCAAYGNAGIEFEPGYAPEDADLRSVNGYCLMKLKVKPMTNWSVHDGEFSELSTRVIFTLSNNEGMTVERSIYLRQRHYGLHVRYDGAYDDDYYFMFGQTEKLLLYGNSAWKATLLPAEGYNPAVAALIDKNNGDSQVAYGDNMSDVEELQFRMLDGANHPDKLFGRSIIRIESQTDPIDFKTVDVLVEAYYGYSFSSSSGAKLVAYPFEQGDYDEQFTYAEAVAKCEGLGGDWYMPTLYDLLGMWSYLGKDKSLRVKHQFYDKEYWAYDVTSGERSQATVDFKSGDTDSYNLSSGKKANVRCVRKREPFVRSLEL